MKHLAVTQHQPDISRYTLTPSLWKTIFSQEVRINLFQSGKLHGFVSLPGTLRNSNLLKLCGCVRRKQFLLVHSFNGIGILKFCIVHDNICHVSYITSFISEKYEDLAIYLTKFIRFCCYYKISTMK